MYNVYRMANWISLVVFTIVLPKHPKPQFTNCSVTLFFFWTFNWFYGNFKNEMNENHIRATSQMGKQPGAKH